MKQYVKADNDYDEYNRFREDLRSTRREFYSAHPGANIDIYEYITDDNLIKAGINWPCKGTQLPDVTKEFAEALLDAAELCDMLNAKYPNILYF